MSRCEKAAPNATQPPRASNAVRRAWMWLIAYALVELCFYIYFEWHNAIYGNVEDYTLFRGTAFLFFAGASFCLFIISLLRRRRAASLIYVVLFAINLYWPFIGYALDRTAKAYFFSAFPGMCPEGRPKPGYRVVLCYEYRLTDWRTALVLNPGDELSAPYTSWPREFDKELFRNADVVVDECEKKHVKLLVNHVYILEDLPEC
jgi:hypothetical protein